MNESAKNALIGFFIIAAASLAIWMLLFLHPSVGNGDQKLNVRFSYIGQVAIGTRVTYAGRPIGQVTAIHEICDSRQVEKVDALGRLYVYQLTLAIDSGIKVYNSDVISLATSGLLGEKSIDITPKPPAPENKPVLVKPGAIIYAQSVSTIESAFNQFEKVGKQVTETLDYVNDFFAQSTADITKGVAAAAKTFQHTAALLEIAQDKHLVENTSNLVENLSDITAAANDPEAIHAIVNNIATISQTFAERSDEISQSIANFERLTRSGANASEDLAQIMQRVANGKGSIGRFLHSDDFYLNVVNMMGKVDTLLNDVNHYGVLFHLNKGWQRMRTSRAAALNELSSPGQFKEYLNQETDTVSTALARIELLLEKASSSEDREKILKSDVFKRDFVELMQAVQNLDDILKMYVQKLAPEAQGSS
jgi:phospholipid/cholesterol/gamma-HCH transport system substrate-binding protein